MYQKLIQEAFAGLDNAYAPYSKFKVAAALLTSDGKIYRGCNIENAAYTPSNCAERTAFFKAVSEGERSFAGICIVNENQKGGHDFCPPCGVCRQVMREFCDPEEFWILLAKSQEEYVIYRLSELFPESFGPENL